MKGDEGKDKPLGKKRERYMLDSKRGNSRGEKEEGREAEGEGVSTIHLTVSATGTEDEDAESAARGGEGGEAEDEDEERERGAPERPEGSRMSLLPAHDDDDDELRSRE